MNDDSQLINDIITRWKSRQSIRAMARDLGISRTKISGIISNHQQVTQSTDARLPPPSLGKAPLVRASKLDPYKVQLLYLLERYPRITAQRALEELRNLGFDGQYSIVRSFIKTHRLKPKPATIRFETAPGVQAQMDWSTYHIDFTQEGRRRVELFSYILGYSRRQYIHFTERQDFETTVRQHIAAFEHLGGVAATCLYDNMKVVVNRWEDGQPIYNTRFLAFATHYGYKPWACQVQRPQTKGKVERPFDYVEKNLLNGRTFRSMEHLNEVARWWLSEINDRRVHGTTKKTPLELHEEEKPHLLTLPALRFDTAQVVYRLVDADYMIAYANNRYSVPWQQIGQMLPIRITEDELQVYNRSLNCIAKHVLKRGPGCEKSVDPKHAPPKDAQEQIGLLRARYAELGPQGSEYFDGLFKKCRNGKHEAQRVLTLLHAYPLADVIAAIGRSIEYHAYGFHSLERILAHFGTPRNSWESLTEHEQQMLKKITESDPIGPRRSEEYQQLLDEVTAETDEDPEQTNPEQTKCTGSEECDAAFGDEPPRQDPPAPGGPEAEDASGSDRPDRS